MPDALRYLKAHKHGTPCDMFRNEDGVDDTGNPTKEARDMATARWDSIMDKMIVAFETNHRMEETAGYNDADQKVVDEGMALFVKHYGSLWD
jgi:hypothetical protein